MGINWKNVLLFGIITLIMGNIISYIFGSISQLKVELPPKCKEWNKYYVMEITLFITGILSYLVFNFFFE